MENKGSGDLSHKDMSEVPISSSPKIASPPPKPPDVELVADGFGFMPRSPPSTGHQSSSRMLKKPAMPKADKSKSEQKHSPCASSCNIDVVRRYTWTTRNRMKVQVITYGATVTCIQVPDRKGVPDDVLAGYDTLEEYFQDRNPYFGATLGRCANIIRDANFIVRPSGRNYMISRNKGRDHIHGGYTGFDKVNWRSYISGTKVIMSYVSERFDEGYPGTLMSQIMFDVTCDNTLKIEMKCTTTEPTIVNLSNMLFFNLAGHHTGNVTMLDHIFTINADKYTAVDEDGYITGEKKVVGGTVYDFRVPKVMKCMLPKIPQGGYDMNFCVTKGTEQDLTFHARALHPGTGRVLEVYSNQPGLQLYTGNNLPDPERIIESANVLDDLGAAEADYDLPPEQPHLEEQGEQEEQEEIEEEPAEQEHVRNEEEDYVIEIEGKVSYGYIPLMGKDGTYYRKHGLFVLMPQNYPDAVNFKNFPSAVLNPGEVYIHKMQYKFGLLLGRYV